MVVPIAAATWVIAAAASLVMVGRGLVTNKSGGGARAWVNELLSVTRRIGKIERYSSLVLAVASVAVFFNGNLNTDLWPFATTAWIALLAQSMFLRPYMANYGELLERGFDRPIERFLVPYVVLDGVMLIPLTALVLNGTT